MSDVNPMMKMILEQSNFVGQSEAVEHQIMPLPEQLSFSIGDKAVLATANTPLERDFVILECIDPMTYVEKFPDWADRLMNSYVLCEYFSQQDPVVSIGWMSRLKILPISEEHYQEALGYLDDGFPDTPPDWAFEYFTAFSDRLSKEAPESVPRIVTCPGCGGRNVALVGDRNIRYTAKAGVLVKDGQDLYVPITEPDEKPNNTAHLLCGDCGNTATLEDREWTFNM